jgi:hypothetical protein
MQTYLAMEKSLQSRLDGLDEFISVERFQRVSDPSSRAVVLAQRSCGGLLAQRFNPPRGADRQSSRRLS